MEEQHAIIWQWKPNRTANHIDGLCSMKTCSARSQDPLASFQYCGTTCEGIASFGPEPSPMSGVSSETLSSRPLRSPAALALPRTGRTEGNGCGEVESIWIVVLGSFKLPASIASTRPHSWRAVRTVRRSRASSSAPTRSQRAASAAGGVSACRKRNAPDPGRPPHNSRTKYWPKEWTSRPHFPLSVTSQSHERGRSNGSRSPSIIRYRPISGRELQAAPRRVDGPRLLVRLTGRHPRCPPSPLRRMSAMHGRLSKILSSRRCWAFLYGAVDYSYWCGRSRCLGGSIAILDGFTAAET
jgi:hypothetical protein